MESLILRTASRLILTIMLVISLLMVLRGHNHPGGGFIGSLIAISGIALFNISHSVSEKSALRRITLLIPLGLILLILSSILAWVIKQPMLTSVWYKFTIFNQEIKTGSPLLFDFGIYFIVLGAITWIITVLEGIL